MMQILVSGIIFGCIYGLTAIGLILIYKTTGTVNFAFGEMSMLIAFVAYMFYTNAGMSYLSFFVLASICAAILGGFTYLFLLKPIQNAPHISQVVLTLGIFMAIHGIAGLLFGHTPTSFPTALSDKTYNLGNVFITQNEIFVMLVALTLMLVFFFILKYTKVGLAMRTSSQDETASKLMGINVPVLFTLVWIIGTVLGGVAGMLIAPTTYLHPSMMSEVLLMAFASAVLGGFISFPGAIIGGIIVGIFGNLISFYIGAELRMFFIFLLILLVLFLRPTGLFGGTQFVKKV